MQTELRICSRELEKGQLWKCAHGYVYIVETGKRIIHYKLLKCPEQKGVMTRMVRCEAMQRYLDANEAELAIAGSWNCF
jgi:hypothetical protein